LIGGYQYLTREEMETKTKRLLLENYKKIYEAMRINCAEKQRIGKFIEELEASLFNTDVYIEDFK
jgi:hypothetical protein